MNNPKYENQPLLHQARRPVYRDVDNGYFRLRDVVDTIERDIGRPGNPTSGEFNVETHSIRLDSGAQVLERLNETQSRAQGNIYELTENRNNHTAGRVIVDMPARKKRGLLSKIEASIDKDGDSDVIIIDAEGNVRWLFFDSSQTRQHSKIRLTADNRAGRVPSPAVEYIIPVLHPRYHRDAINRIQRAFRDLGNNPTPDEIRAIVVEESARYVSGLRGVVRKQYDNNPMSVSVVQPRWPLIP